MTLINWQSTNEQNVKVQQPGANIAYAGLTSPTGGKFTSDFIAAATADFRCPKAMVEVTWGAGDVDENVVISSNDINRIDRTGQIINGVTASGQKWAYLHSGLKADGTFHVMPERDVDQQAGWYGTSLQSDGSGNFSTAPYIHIAHDARSYTAITVAGDSGYNEYPVDFTLTFTHAGGPTVVAVTGNTERVYSSAFTAIKDVTALTLIVTKWSAANTIIKITQLSGTLIELYKAGDIVSIDILEETNSDTGIVPVGNVSSNELDLALMNTERRFSYGNTDSVYNTSLRSGRKIRAWLGFVLPSGSLDQTGDAAGYIVDTVAGEKIGLMPYGVYWSKDWISSYESMVTNTTAYDVTYLLSQKEFLKSANYTGTVKSIVDDILLDAKEEIPELYWAVSADTSLLTWTNVAFEPKTYLEVLKEIAEASQSFTFVNRSGVIIVGSFLEAATPLESWQQIDLSGYYDYRSDPKIDELINRVRVGYTDYGISTDIYDSDRVYTIGATGSKSVPINWNTSGVITSSVVITLTQLTGASIITSSEIYESGADVETTGDIGSTFQLSATGIPRPLIYSDEELFTIPANGSLEMYLSWSTAPVNTTTVVIDLAPIIGLPVIEVSETFAYGATLRVLGLPGETFKLSAKGIPYSLRENTETLAEDAASIGLYGVREFALTGNILINSFEQAQNIAAQLLAFYGSLRQDAALTWPATTLLAVGDTLEVVEFKSDTVETKGYFIIKRQTTTYEGSMQAQADLRRG